MDIHSHHKALIAPLRHLMYDFDIKALGVAFEQRTSPDFVARLTHPVGEMRGVKTYIDNVYAPLVRALPDLERRDYIVMAGTTQNGDHWVGCGGFYTGTFAEPWLDISPTGHQVGMRFHEFYRIVDDRIAEIQSLWDIPEMMMQAGAWPLAPALGREWQVPGPATQDGIIPGPYDDTQSAASLALVLAMLEAMNRHPAHGGPEVMQLEKFWHPKMSWYGPSGIGTARGIKGFRNWHQIPFLNAMPDRGQYDDEIDGHMFGDGNFVAATGWPNMRQTVKNDGWLGIAPSNKKIGLRSLDFWRLENGLIRENWVLVDLLHVYDQLGIDVFARLREFNKARSSGGFEPRTGRATYG